VCHWWRRISRRNVEVALEYVPADAAGAGGACGGEEPREPGERPDAAVAGLRLQAGAQPPSRPPFGQVLEPLLADAGELQGGALGDNSKAAHVPGVAGVLIVPAGALGDGGDLAVRVDQQRDRVLAPHGMKRAGGPPVLLAAAEQRGLPAAGEPADHGPDSGGLGPDHVVVVPALQGVLDFQPQPVGQRGQVRPFPAVGGLIVTGGEFLQVRAAELLPPPVVGVAQGGPWVRPQLAVADPAGSLPGIGDGGRQPGEPFAVVARFPGPLPCAQVPGAEPAACRPETAARDLAAGQRRMPEPRPGRVFRHGEGAGIGTPGVSPPLVVAMAHADRPRGPVALRDAAGIAAEHRPGGIEHQDAGPELRAHRGHQLFQQAGRSPVLPAIRSLRAGHRLSCSPSKTVAVTLTAMPLRTPRACR